MIMHSPFQFGKTVVQNRFINRTGEVSRLRNNFESGINTIIISPRRWGKSSLVSETARLVSNKNKQMRICFIDMFSIRSEEEFYETLTREVIKSASGKVEEWLKTAKDFFKKVVPKLSVTLDPVRDIAVSFDWNEAKKYRNEILDLAEMIAARKKLKIVICIDEFQNIEYFSDSESFEKILRSRWQHHRHVSYCLYGSKRHMMNTIFNGKNKPFYRFGDMMYLEKIKRDHWVTFICKEFLNTGKKINQQTSAQIADTMKCHPYYVQQLAHHVWNHTSHTADHQTVQTALDEMLEYNAIFYQKEVDILSNTQLNFLKAVADGIEQFTSVSTMQTYRLGTPNNVTKNRNMLEKADIIDVTKDSIDFLDPAFELWFKKYFLKRTITL